MNLSPEDKAVGKENFHAAIGSDVRLSDSDPNRREFLQERIDESLAIGDIPGYAYFGYESSPGEGGPVRVGVIGTGDEGSVLIGAINPDYVEVKSIADIRPYNVYRAFHGDVYSATAMAVRCGLIAKYDWADEDEARQNVKVYGEYHELIDSAAADGIEAVIIALPLHLHAPAAVAAMRAGLHVLTEKLMAHSVHECKEMARVADETGKHLATGHQRHYNILYANAVDLIARGVLGDLHYIRAQWHRSNLPGTDSWQQPMPKEAKPDDVQAEKLLEELDSWNETVTKIEEKVTKLEANIEDRNGKIAHLETLDRSADAEPFRKQIVGWKKDIVGLTKDLAAWEKKIKQKEMQISDKDIVGKVEQFGYEAKQIKDGEGNVVYDRPAMEELIRWRLWDRTGGGLMAELGSHQLDAASIFIAAMNDGKKQYPLSVAAASNRPVFPADRDVDDHVYCLFEFPGPGYDPDDPNNKLKKIGVQYASINGNGYGGYGETVMGTKGTLLLERETDAMLWKTSVTDSKTKVVVAEDKDEIERLGLSTDDGDDPKSAAIGHMAVKDAGRGYQQQIEHWAWCIRKNPDNSDPDIHPRCYPKVALGDAVIALTTNMAAREGKRIEFDKDWFDPDNDATPEGVKPDVSRYDA